MCPSERYARRDGATAGAGRDPLRPAFDVLDADRDGRIGRDDLKAFYRGGGAAEDEAIGSMIAAADADRDGYVAFEEFERAVLRGGGGGGGVMEEVFRAMDRDGDGRVGFADLRGYMDWAALPATDDDVRAMLRMACGEEEGVSYEGLLKILSFDSISLI